METSSPSQKACSQGLAVPALCICEQSATKSACRECQGGQGIGIATDEELFHTSKERQRAQCNKSNKTHGMFLPQRVCLLQPGVPICEERERGSRLFIDRHVLDWQGIQLGWVYTWITFLFCLGHLKLRITIKSRLHRL